jgi:NADH-quinone oxidoreductase subunit L
VAAAGHVAPWLAMTVVVAGALSAAYATRFQLLAWGRDRSAAGPGPRQLVHRPGRVETGAMAALATATIGLAVLWLPPVHDAAARLVGGTFASGPPWELGASLLGLGVGVYAVVTADRQHRLGHVGTLGATARWGDWLRLPTLTRRTVVDPALTLAAAAARFDDRVVARAVGDVGGGARRTAAVLATAVEPAVERGVTAVAGLGHRLADLGAHVAERGVDGAVAAVAWLVDRAATDARRSHTGMVHDQFVVIVVGLGLVAVATVLGR